MEQVILITTGIITAIATSIGAVVTVLNWRSRNELDIRCQANTFVKTLIDPYLIKFETQGPYITFRIANKGQWATEITHFYICHYNNLSERIKRKKRMVFPTNIEQELPKRLAPGKTWNPQILQEDLIKKIGEHGFFYYEIKHSMSKKLTIKRIRIEQKPKDYYG